MIAFGRKLAELRHARLLTQQQLSERAGVSVQALRALEAGRAQWPRPATTRNLAKALAVDPFDLANPGLTAAQVLRRAERPSGGGVPMAASFAPLPLSVVIATAALPQILQFHGMG